LTNCLTVTGTAELPALAFVRSSSAALRAADLVECAQSWAVNNARVPAAVDSSNESRALMILGRIDEAKKILDGWWQQKGYVYNSQIDQRYRIAFFENDKATMERLTREAPADDIVWLGLQEQLAFFRGDFGKLRSLSEALVKQQKRAQRMENAASELAWHALLESYLENYALARKLCRQASEASKDRSFGLGHCAKALAETGDLPHAEALAAKLERLRPEDTLDQEVHLRIIRSTIERERGNGAKAVDLLAPVAQYEQGQPQVLYHRAQAYLAAQEPEKAAAEFQKLTGLRGWTEWAVFAPLAQLGLARAYAAQGDRENSSKAYDAFFTTWKDADPNIPILRQAKAEYEKLTATASAAVSASAKIQ
jgi:tetratricopeptide (TPR) repeat protein